MKTNKEVINALQEFFLKQDPKDIARALAACMIDFQRMVNFEKLGSEEKACLQARLLVNVEELQRFAKEGPRNDEPFRCINIESDES